MPVASPGVARRAERGHGRDLAHISIYMEIASFCEPLPLQSAALTASPKGTPSLLRARRRWPEGPEEVHGQTGKNKTQLQVLASVAARARGREARDVGGIPGCGLQGRKGAMGEISRINRNILKFLHEDGKMFNWEGLS